MAAIEQEALGRVAAWGVDIGGGDAGCRRHHRGGEKPQFFVQSAGAKGGDTDTAGRGGERVGEGW